MEAAFGDRCKACLAGGGIKWPSGSRPQGTAGVAMARYASLHFLSKGVSLLLESKHHLDPLTGQRGIWHFRWGTRVPGSDLLFSPLVGDVSTHEVGLSLPDLFLTS